MKKTEILSRDINEEFVEKWDDFLKFVKNPFYVLKNEMISKFC